MPRSTGVPRNRAVGRTKKAVSTVDRSAETRGDHPGPIKRLATLADVYEYCRAAQHVADAHGEKLLGYLLAMAAHEGAEAVNREKSKEAAAKRASPQRK